MTINAHSGAPLRCALAYGVRKFFLLERYGTSEEVAEKLFEFCAR